MSQPSPDAKAVVRAAEALTTQVRRIADALSTPVVRTEVAADDDTTTTHDGPRCVCGDPIEWWIGPDKSAGWIHRPVVGSVPLTAHRPRPADNALTTPATTCSAQYTGPDAPWCECIRVAHHEHPFHTDASGWNWRDDVAVYPVDPGRVRVAHWLPMPQQVTEERQELATMVGQFIDAQVQQAQADEEQTLRWTRRESLLVLLTRLQRGRALSETEAGTLRQHVETEIREADTARSVAAGNKRHVQSLVPELEQAQAAIERVRALPEDPLGGHAPQGAGQESYVRGWSFAIHAVHEAIDGTEPTTEA